MNWELFENKIKGAFSGHQSDVDADAIWKAIEPAVDELNRRRKRRAIIWLWLVGVAIAVVGTIGFVFYGKSSPSLAAEASGINAPQFEHQTPAAQNSDPFEKSIMDSTSDKPVPSGISPASKSANEMSENHGIKNGNTSPGIESKAKELQHSQALASKNNRNISPENHEFLKVASNPDIREKATELQHSQALAPDITIDGSNTGSATHISPNNFTSNNQTLDPLQPSTLSLFPIKHAKPVLIPALANFDDKKQDSKSKRFSLEAVLRGGVGMVSRQMILREAYFDKATMARRDSTELPLEAVQIGALVTLRHRSGFGLGTGIGFVQINERAQLNKTISQQDSMFGIHHYLVNLYDDTIAVYDNFFSSTIIKYRKTNFNNYRLYEIPIVLNYLKHRGKWIYGAEAGVYANIAMNSKGKILDGNYNFSAVDTANIYKNKIGISYQIAIMAGYSIGKKTSLYLSPYYRRFSNDFTKDQYAIRQRYNLLGINAGLRYSF